MSSFLSSSWVSAHSAGSSSGAGSWAMPNYINPPTHGNSCLIVICVLGGLATVILFARLYARLIHVYAAGLDDLLMGLSWACSRYTCYFCKFTMKTEVLTF